MKGSNRHLQTYDNFEYHDHIDKYGRKLDLPFHASPFKPSSNAVKVIDDVVRLKQNADYVPIKIDEYGLKGKSPLRKEKGLNTAR